MPKRKVHAPEFKARGAMASTSHQSQSRKIQDDRAVQVSRGASELHVTHRLL